MRANFSVAIAFFAVAIYFLVLSVAAEQSIDFEPKVTASCGEMPYMKIQVSIGQPFHGVVQTVTESRSDACKVYGDGSANVSMRLNVLARPNDADFCGVLKDPATDERRVALYVRYHRSLERKEDKVFSVSCGNPGYRTSSQDLSRISLSFVEDGQRTKEVVKGHQYLLRVEQSKPDPSRQLKVNQCFGFGASDDRVELTDSRGCPLDPDTMTGFKYDPKTGSADAIVFSMFKFPGTTAVNINCLVAVCNGACKQEACDSNSVSQGRNVEDRPTDQFWTSESADVFETDRSGNLVAEDCTVQRFTWLLSLCIVFGVLFVVMLIVNILLCSALTCSCAKQEVVEREPSVIEDYDPYKGGWSGSQYGSRYSLNGKHNYGFGGSTPNSTTRSVSTNSDHYAIVHSQPGSRYQGTADDRSSKGGFARGPESTLSHAVRH